MTLEDHLLRLSDSDIIGLIGVVGFIISLCLWGLIGEVWVLGIILFHFYL